MKRNHNLECDHVRPNRCDLCTTWPWPESSTAEDKAVATAMNCIDAILKHRKENTMNVLSVEFSPFSSLLLPEFDEIVLFVVHRRSPLEADFRFGHLSQTDRQGHHIRFSDGASTIVNGTGATVLQPSAPAWSIAGWAKMPRSESVRAFCMAITAGNNHHLSQADNCVIDVTRIYR